MKNEQLFIDQFITDHPDIALATIDELPAEDIALLTATLSVDQCLIIFSWLVPYKAGKVFEKMSQDDAIRLLELLPLSIAESILRVCNKTVGEQLLNGLPPGKTKLLLRALGFKKDQVGAHLDPYVFTLPDYIKIDKALVLIKSSEASVKPKVFVIDSEKKLVGYVEPFELIRSQSDLLVKTVMKTVDRTVFAEMSVKDCIQNWDDNFTDLPVMKVNGEFMGTVSRASLSGLEISKSRLDNSAVKAGNALGELYAIGLTSLLGSAEVKMKS